MKRLMFATLSAIALFLPAAASAEEFQNRAWNGRLGGSSQEEGVRRLGGRRDQDRNWHPFKDRDGNWRRNEERRDQDRNWHPFKDRDSNWRRNEGRRDQDKNWHPSRNQGRNWSLFHWR